MKIHLFRSMGNLLREIAGKYGVQLSADDNGREQFDLSESIRRELIDAISTEFVETGLTENNEPNQRGIRLEELLDALNKVEKVESGARSRAGQ
jgi:hypothetical protein